MIAAAARLVRTGKSFGLALNFDSNGPERGGKGSRRFNPVHTMLRTGSHACLGHGDIRGIRAADDMITMPLQCGTQWDALSHIFYGDYMWNGYDARLVTAEGTTRKRNREDPQQDGRARCAARHPPPSRRRLAAGRIRHRRRPAGGVCKGTRGFRRPG